MTDAKRCHVSLSRSADAALCRLGIRPAADHWARRRCVVDAAYGGMEPIDRFQETHFLARAMVDGQPVVLLCLTVTGSPRGDKELTTIIRGAFSETRAAELMAKGKGLAPFCNELRSPIPGGKAIDERDDHAD